MYSYIHDRNTHRRHGNRKHGHWTGTSTKYSDKEYTANNVTLWSDHTLGSDTKTQADKDIMTHYAVIIIIAVVKKTL